MTVNEVRVGYLFLSEREIDSIICDMDDWSFVEESDYDHQIFFENGYSIQWKVASVWEDDTDEHDEDYVYEERLLYFELTLCDPEGVAIDFASEEAFNDGIIDTWYLHDRFHNTRYVLHVEQKDNTVEVIA